MIVLAIESSCDDLSCAVFDGQHKKLLAMTTRSGVESHIKFEGVVPEIAARDHLVNMEEVIDRTLAKAGLRIENIQGVCATRGPGLIGSLLVGYCYAQALAVGAGLPFVGINHLQAHAHAFRLVEPKFSGSFLALVVSGGHTELARFSPGRIEPIGSTRDDAAGEAFDKVARLLGLGYPGGPAIEKAAGKHMGRGEPFTIPKMKDGSADFSFSGLKTAVALRVRGQHLSEHEVRHIAKGFQETVALALAGSVAVEARKSGDKILSLGGGVAANQRIREEVEKQLPGITIKLSPLEYCGDNAAMIALLGSEKLMQGDTIASDLGPNPGLLIHEN